MEIEGSDAMVFAEATQAKILDLSTSNKELLTLMQEKFSDSDLAPADQILLQSAFSQRQQSTSLLTSLVGNLFETARGIVQNFR